MIAGSTHNAGINANEAPIMNARSLALAVIKNRVIG
jgi:hypothetical protein